MSALPVFPTQGPWFAEQCGKFWEIQISPGLLAPSFASVHINPHIDMSAEDASSAARLIAAAPEMLAALRALVQALEGAPSTRLAVALSRIGFAKDAIATAEGRSDV